MIMQAEAEWLLMVDGAARGNPGEAGCGAAILDEHGALVKEMSRYLGRATNNVAEYEALLMGLEALVALGYGHDPRLSRSLALIREKQDGNGRWSLEYDYAGKTWVDFGAKKQPNKWVTLRALRVLKAVGAG